VEQRVNTVAAFNCDRNVASCYNEAVQPRYPVDMGSAPSHLPPPLLVPRLLPLSSVFHSLYLYLFIFVLYFLYFYSSL